MRVPVSFFIFLALVTEVLGQQTTFWYETIAKQGVAPYNAHGASSQVYRNVKDFGAKGDGVTDDTAAINAAISNGTRCAPGPPGIGCQSSTTSPANVYFPTGTYLISSPIILYYMTNLIGNPNTMPTLKAVSSFPASAIAMVDGDEYTSANPTYGTTNVFYRQIRNLVFDMTSAPSVNLVRGIHWPTAQATSLQNLVFKMSTASGNQHVGVFIENGSGGFLSDLVFYGGNQAMAVGSQQFTNRNLTFYNSATAIYMGFDWSWTYIGLSVNNCSIGLDMSNGGNSGQLVGSVTILDSTFNNVPLGINTAHTISSTTTAGSLSIENSVFNNVPAIVKGPSGVTLAGSSGTTYQGAWVQGNRYIPNGPTHVETSVSSFSRPASMVTGSLKDFYFRSKPQYQNVPSSNFSSVRTGGAKGDGVTDDTAAIQAVINSAASAGKIVYFDAGIYKITATINIGPGARIVGEAYPVILASGTLWNNIAHPVPVVRVGAASGQSGVVEWSDMIVSTQGAMAGAVLIQWNLASPASTPSGMWDVHTRIGGFKGSNLQTTQCPITGTQPNTNCIAAWQSMLVGNIANGLYLENNWFWTADHDLDDVANNNTRISVYSGRGLTIESTIGNIWLVGTAVEHHDLYQYQFYGTKNVFMGLIQTETPYYQPTPSAVTPFVPFSGRNDPDFTTFCKGKAASCNMAWGLRVLNSTNILGYGAGLYSFFNNYDTTCSNHTSTVYNEYCQTQIFGIDEGGNATYSGSSVFMYGLSTVGSVSMIDWLGSSIAAQKDNTNAFASSVIRFVTNAPGS